MEFNTFLPVYQAYVCMCDYSYLPKAASGEATSSSLNTPQVPLHGSSESTARSRVLEVRVRGLLLS